MNRTSLVKAAGVFFAVILSVSVHAQAASSFAYQGRLDVSGTAATGTYDLRFKLFKDAAGTTQVGATLFANNLAVANGLFSTTLDFGANAFDGTARYLEISVRPGAQTGAYTALLPRQAITATPYALFAQSAAALGADLATANNATRTVTMNNSTLSTTDSQGRVRAATSVFSGGESGFATWGPNGSLNLDLSSPLDNLDNGYVGVADSRGEVQTAVSVFDNGAGGLLAWGPDDSLNVSIGSTIDNASHGAVEVADERGETQGNLYVAATGEGAINLWGPNDSLNVDISASADDPNLGFVGVNDSAGNYQAAMGVYDTGEGTLATWGSNGSLNVDISSPTGLPDHGFVGVADETGDLRAGAFVDADGDGILFGDFQLLATDHPLHADRKIVYGSLDGPEAGIYDRGTVKLVNGGAFIQLPEHFTALADPQSLSVQLTPESFDSKGLGYQRLDDGRIEVRELAKGTGNYAVSYLVQAKRANATTPPPVMTKQEFEKQFKGPATKRLAGQGKNLSRPTHPDAGKLKK